ncbi:MAG: geranylgeranyl diphosphate synthase, type [Actinomycetota bacterium]|nr:geranylgeranyl diphosphate synthase, type [Actinomycetota bacterium]
MSLIPAVDERIHAFLDERKAAIPETGILIEEIRRVVSAGGKRLRPQFCYWGFRSAGGKHGPEIISVTTAFELLHTFAIVHDDIMDSARERRGQPTTVELMGMERALLVGDLALVLADAAFWGSEFPVETLCAAFSEFTIMREQVIAGQHMDLEAHDSEVDEAAARAIAVLKSGSYSIEHPLLIGARLADADTGTIEGLRLFGRPLGEAFQLVDDLLGVFGDAETTGKPIDSDIREGKRNVLFAKTLSALDGADRTFFLDRWGRGDALDESVVGRLRDLIQVSGARRETEDLVVRLASEAAIALASAAIDGDARTALEGLMDQAIRRSK